MIFYTCGSKKVKDFMEIDAIFYPFKIAFFSLKNGITGFQFRSFC